MEQGRVRTDVEAASRWMTKAELATARGISVESADRLIRRQGWRKVPGNDGRARVLVPLSGLRTFEQPRADSPTDAPAPAPTDNTQAVHIAEAALATLREQIGRERVRADSAQADRDRLTARVAEAEASLAAVTARAEAAEAARDRAEGRADRLTTAAAQTEAVLAGERTRADRAETAITSELLRADVLRDKLDTVRYDLDMARQAAAQAAETLRQADAKRKARGRLRRVLAAWRGE
jgi:hypothetical protein